MQKLTRRERKIQRKINYSADDVIEFIRDFHGFSSDKPVRFCIGSVPKETEPEDFIRRVGERALLRSGEYPVKFPLHYEHIASVVLSGAEPVITPDGNFTYDPSTIGEVVIVYSRISSENEASDRTNRRGHLD